MEKTSAKINGKNSAYKKTIAKKYFILFVLSIIIAFIVKILDTGLMNFGRALLDTYVIIQLLSLISINTVILSALLFYILQTKRKIIEDNKFVKVVFLAVLITLIASYLFGSLINVFIMPLTLSGLLIGILVDKRAALFSNILINVAFFLCFVVLYGSQQIMATASTLLIGILAGTYMILMMEKTYTRMRFLISGITVGIIVAPVAMLSAAVIEPNNFVDILYTALWAFLSVLIAVTLFITILPAFEKMFKLTTNFGLEEICSFDAKLLKRLSEEAPGTFNHSLSVGNLAQLCALAIGENPQLAKAGAYYHDVGKLKDPQCYVENQKGYNPHDDFIPEVSVHVITHHTIWGKEMIKKANLPDIIADIAVEHHGTTPVNYFYNKVKKITEETVERKDFSYDGPIPSNRISAIIMITDTVEAATRAKSPNDEEDIRIFIHKLIDEKRKLGQFDNCNLTFKQLKQIEDTLVDVMPGIYHSRISYEEKK